MLDQYFQHFQTVLHLDFQDYQKILFHLVGKFHLVGLKVHHHKHLLLAQVVHCLLGEETYMHHHHRRHLQMDFLDLHNQPAQDFQVPQHHLLQ
jgi:hypothetical protein